jgi:hypothetical protein
MRVLMLGGARDEVVPRSQMQELWAIIRRRGRARDAEKSASLSASSTKTTVPTREKTVSDDDDDAKVPPRVITDGGNTYIEFDAGTHSACFILLFFRWFRNSFFAVCR